MVSARLPLDRGVASRVLQGFTTGAGSALAWAFLAVGTLIAAVHGSGVDGSKAGLLVLVVGTPVLGLRAVAGRRSSQQSAWPWVAFILAGLAGAAAAAARPLMASTGELGAERSVVSDVASLLAYGFFAAGLVGLLQRHRSRVATGWIAAEAAVLGLSTVLVLWGMVLDPVMIDQGAVTGAKLVVVAYPGLAAMLVHLAVRLALAGPATAAHRLLVAGVVCLLVGELVFLPVEVGRIEDPGALLELPAAMAYVFVGAAVLHPSLPALASPTVVARYSRSEIAFTLAALLLPVVVLSGWEPASRAERLLGAVLAAALVLLAGTRLMVAVREHPHRGPRPGVRSPHDLLTGLPNREEVQRSLTELLHHPASVTLPIAVLALDLDDFALVNDTHGHLAGDELLVASGSLLRATVGPHARVGRLSGDDFVVVSPGMGPADAWSLASVLRRGFMVPVRGVDHFVTFSVGIALSPGPHRHVDAATMLQDADTALYHAKLPGHDGVAVFDPAMLTVARRRSQIQHGLRHAIDNDELSMHYQPIVAVGGDRVDRFEALLRWRSAEGDVSPSDFIPIAEETGMIGRIGSWALTEACRQVAEWRRMPGCEDLTVAVNVSARQICSAGLVPTVRSALRVSGLPGSALWLEITEGAMLDDSASTMSVLLALRALDVRLSVDDFGTGFSSLAYLDRFPIQQVKVDRSFVQALEPEGDAPVVSAIVKMADALGLEVVAEGVEEPHQLARLREMGCGLAQGFLYAPALAAGPAGELLTHRRLPPGGELARR